MIFILSKKEVFCKRLRKLMSNKLAEKAINLLLIFQDDKLVRICSLNFCIALTSSFLSSVS